MKDGESMETETSIVTQVRKQKIKLDLKPNVRNVKGMSCTPLMAIAHAPIPQAAEIMFCDCTSSLDQFNITKFISTCHGILLGILTHDI